MLISWGLSLSPGCVLCSVSDESHQVLAAVVWNRFMAGTWRLFLPLFQQWSDLCRNLQGPHATWAVEVLKLLNQVIIYNLWRERNTRIFKDVTMTQEFFKMVDRFICGICCCLFRR